MADTLQGFLDEIGKKYYGIAHLYRGNDDGSMTLVTKHNARDYLKPDYGYGVKMRPYYIMNIDRLVASFKLYEFPSCCAFCISTEAFTAENKRKLGINKIANRLRQWIAKEQGYAALLCTDVADNVPERKTLKANEWQDIFTIKNPRTGNIVNISVKIL
jgi:hypothetical protein